MCRIKVEITGKYIFVSGNWYVRKYVVYSNVCFVLLWRSYEGTQFVFLWTTFVICYEPFAIILPLAMSIIKNELFCQFDYQPCLQRIYSNDQFEIVIPGYPLGTCHAGTIIILSTEIQLLHIQILLFNLVVSRAIRKSNPYNA